MTDTFDPERWARIRATFDDLVELDDELRSDKLKSISESDPQLANTVMQLLAADKAADERLATVERAFSSDEDNIDLLHLTGRTISHFRIIEPIAGGGMGVVYKAEDLKLGRIVALKFPLPERHISRQIRQRFLNEAHSIAKVDHPNICSIYEAAETEDSHLFIAMPFYRGETLRARLEREPRLDIADAIGIATQTAKGLSAAHKAGIVHRDLKPANIMLLDDGTAKILDFGLAKVSDLTLTTSSVRVGTAMYMAPEQVEGKPLDGRTDLWALGVVLYEMIAGQRPFSGDSDVSIAHSILHRPPAPPSIVRPEINTGLEEVILRLLAKEPADRFQSADELIEELSQVSSGKQPVRVVAASKHSPLPNTLTAVAAALVIAAASYLLWRQRTEAAADGRVQSVAVFPFVTSSDSSQPVYMARGISDEVATLLTRISRLRVVNKTDMLHSMSADSALAAAKKLGVSKLITGEVLRDGNRSIAIARVVDVGTPTKASAKTIEINPSDLRTAPSVMVQEILTELRIKPSKAERTLITQSPTTNRTAYDLYLRGRDAETGREQEGWKAAQPFYWRARETDPQFAMARARLALTHAQLALFGDDSSEARREQARIEAEAALKLNPGLPEPHAALGYYWLTRHDDVRAIASLQHAVDIAPSNPDVHMTLGVIDRRNGRWEEAATEFERVSELKPDDAFAAGQAAGTYSRMRRYGDAVRMWNRSLAINPADGMGWVIRGSVYLRWQGQADTLEEALTHLPKNRDFDGARTHGMMTVARVRRRYADALRALDEAQAAYGDDLLYRPTPLLRGLVLREMGDMPKARRQFAIAEKIIKDSLAADPDNPAVHIALGLAYAGLGQVDLARAEAKKSTELAPLARNALTATAFAGDAAAIYTMVGDNDAALQLLGLLLAMPAGREVSVPLLRADPTWDPLRKDPRFERLLQQYSQ